MVKIHVENKCSDFSSYRAARVKSLFNCETGANFDITADLPSDDDGWTVGVVVGPSGSGKTSIGRLFWPGVQIYDHTAGWPRDAPIVDAIALDGDFNAVTGALSAVGLGDVPAWLRPFHALSNGEQFRAGMARLVAEAPSRVVVDEFTSVVDRQIAKIGAAAFSKAWKRTKKQCLLLSCHYDILEWVEPDWVFDTRTGQLARGALWRRPKFDLEIFQTDGSYWQLFEPHHYLKLPRMIAAKYYVGFVNGEAVAHIAFSPKLEIGGMRGCRMVVMPEWQGAGVGMRFLNWTCAAQFTEINKYSERTKAVYFHTSHPGLCAALRRDRRWVQVSSALGGAHKGRSARSVERSKKNGARNLCGNSAGYGGHLRSVQGFKMTREGASI